MSLVLSKTVAPGRIATTPSTLAQLVVPARQQQLLLAGRL